MESCGVHFSFCELLHLANAMNFVLLQIIAKGKRDWHDEVDILLRHSQHPNIVTLYNVSVIEFLVQFYYRLMT